MCCMSVYMCMYVYTYVCMYVCVYGINGRAIFKHVYIEGSISVSLVHSKN